MADEYELDPTDREPDWPEDPEAKPGFVQWLRERAAMPTRNVNLTEHFDEFIENGVASGRFSNASEMVREGLRLLEQREQEDRAKLEWLRSAVQEGIDDLERGDYTTLRSRAEIDAFMNQIHDEVGAEEKAAPKRG